MEGDQVRLTIDGTVFAAPATITIIQAYATSQTPLVKNVGCMGQGVCGSCRCMVRRAGSREVTTELACETLVEDGMQVSFIDYFTPRRPHVYQMEDVADSWRVNAQLNDIFPEARHCRHCGGCDRSCPKAIEVQRGVNLASGGDIRGASEVFEACIMCNLCTLACPEYIRPNHVGLFARRAVTALSLRPSDLIARLEQIETGAMGVDIEAVEEGSH
ncbi:MAG: ferredoxin [Acetobacteraceae bacterium]|nr:ferredoxin [Acetobacteraceae bacterium]